MLVVLRAGPYMCGEWDFGGFPYWLLRNGSIPLRTYAEPYFSLADGWFRKVLDTIEPLLYANGGPIVMVQVENEYGSFGNVMEEPSDRKYMEELIGTARDALGPEAILFTTDGGNLGYMQKGSFNGSSVLTVGDGCGDVQQCWDAQKAMNPPGKSPNMVSEFYTGWLTHWGEPMANTSANDTASHLENILSTNGSVSLYMAHGGTNFGFWAGANGETNKSYQADLTSYDYDAPLSEGGEHGYGSDNQDKFEALQTVFARYWDPDTDGGDSPPPEPELLPRGDILQGKPLAVPYLASLLEPSTLRALAPNGPVATGLSSPGFVEKYNCSYGFSIFSATLSRDLVGANMSFPAGPADRAHVFVAEKLQSIIFKGDPVAQASAFSFKLGPEATKDAKLEILVENTGRLNFDRSMGGTKGLPYGVWLEGKAFDASKDGWTVQCLRMRPEEVQKVRAVRADQKGTSHPSFYKTVFQIPKAMDTYIEMGTGWGKGLIWVNSNAIGRYWPTMGPQQRLFIPSPYLMAGQDNANKQKDFTVELILLELDHVPEEPIVQFFDEPRFGNATVMKGKG
mmetsp:Transcript_26095/g.62872  ORF Transcript_26095/g.62872 Transcript_26095/m.62872 type:complete len:567 (-) Transcript_26095:168-1868(-)